MIRIHSMFFVLSGLLVGATATAQDEVSAYFERQVMLTVANGELKSRDVTIAEPKLVKGDGVADSEVELRFARNDKALPVNADFIAALIHNVELAPPKGNGVWRLRRARCERAPGVGGSWIIKELVFGCRHEGVDGQGALVALPRGRRATWDFFRDVVGEEPAGVQWRSIDVDMTGKQPRLTAAIEVRGDDYKKRFLAVETALADRCKKPDGPFVAARWRGDEEPAADKKGATFTLELRIRRQLERKVRRRRR